MSKRKEKHKERGLLFEKNDTKIFYTYFFKKKMKIMIFLTRCDFVALSAV